MVKNKKCLACRTSYSHCPGCSRADRLAPAWKSQFCDEDCMNLWMALTRYNMNILTKNEAKEIISKINLKPIDSYVECVRRDYDKVMAEEKKSRKIKKSAPVVEEPMADTIVEPVVMPEFVLETAVVELPDVQTEQLEEVAIPTVAQVETETVETVHEVVLKEEK